MISILEFTKGHNSKENVDGVMILNLCTLSADALYLFSFVKMS